MDADIEISRLQNKDQLKRARQAQKLQPQDVRILDQVDPKINLYNAQLSSGSGKIVGRKDFDGQVEKGDLVLGLPIAGSEVWSLQGKQADNTSSDSGFADKKRKEKLAVGAVLNISGGANQQRGVPFIFTVTRSVVTVGASRVNWAASSSSSGFVPTDLGGSAYPSGGLHFANGETTKTITVTGYPTTVSSTNAQALRQFNITLSSPSTGTTINTATAGGSFGKLYYVKFDYQFTGSSPSTSDLPYGYNGVYTFAIRSQTATNTVLNIYDASGNFVNTTAALGVSLPGTANGTYTATSHL